MKGLSNWLLAALSAVSLSPQCFASNIASVQEPLADSAGKKHTLHLTSDLIAFHKNLTQIESISGNEKAVGDWLFTSLKSQGYNVEKQYISHEPRERFNVLAWPGKNRDARVMLSSHIDTVPPFLPYKRTVNEKNTTIFGRGSVDAKGSVATQILAVNSLISSNTISPDSISLLFVVGEEVGGIGMRTANNLSLTPSTIIFGEPTEGKLVSGHKGTMRIGLKAIGKAGHSGYPWLGRSANEVLVSALGAFIGLGENLPQSEKYGTTTFNIGKMEGGVAGNVIAESATADITTRIAAGTPSLIKKAVTEAVNHAIKDFLEDGLKPQDVLELDFSGPGYGPIDIDHDVPGFEVFIVNYGTDIPWLKTETGTKRYLYGPGTIFVAHSANEEVLESELFGAVEGYEKIILHALGKGE